MEKFGLSHSGNSPRQLAALFTAATMLASSAYAQGPAATSPPAPGASGAADPDMSNPPETPTPPPAQSSEGADAQCRTELEHCRNGSRVISDGLTACRVELNKCLEARQTPPAPRETKRVKRGKKNGKTIWEEEEIMTLPPDRTGEILDALRRSQQSAAVALPMQTTSVVVNVYNNPQMDNSNAVNSHNRGTQSAQPQQSGDMSVPPSSGLDLYGRMGAGGDYTFDGKRTESFLIEGQAMVRNRGVFGFGARAAAQMTPERESWIGNHKGTVPTNSVLVEGCAEKAPSSDVGPGFTVGACAGVQQEMANDVVDDTDESIRLTGWKRKYPRASLYLGGTFKFTDRIGAYVLARIAGVFGRRDSVRDDNHQEHTVPEVGVTAGVTFD